MKNHPPFHIWVRRARLELDMGRVELAQQAGCSQAMIRQIEYGNRRPSRDLARRLANQLQIPAEERQAFLRAARVPQLEQEPAPAPEAEPEPEANDPGDEAEAEPEAGDLGDDQLGWRRSVPEVPNQLIGREEELRSVMELICAPETRLVTLVGPGGVGKTRLAIQLAYELSASFPDGVFFVSLAALSEQALIPIVIAQALDVLDSKAEPSLEQLIELLDERKCLLVLDNAEHLPAIQPLISTLLDQCAGLKMIVTSRAALRLRLEHQYVLPPLPVPAAEALALEGSALLELLAPNPAVKLFVSRARLAVPAFALSAENAATVAQICRRLDGLPLAIELAAVRIRGLPPQTMLARLNTQLELLTSGGVDLPQRQQTMRALIDWSYTLLTPVEQTVLRRLGVFSGDWTIEAAEAVCAGAGVAQAEILPTVLALFDKSLCQEQHRSGDSAAFILLQVIREYALERLEQAGEDDQLRQCHASYYIELGSEAERHLTGPQQQRWLDLLASERDNLRAALDWLQAQGAAEPTLRLIGALWKFWQFRDYWSEGMRRIEAALALPAEQTPAYLRARARVLYGAGWLAVRRRNMVLSQAMFEESLAISRAIQDQEGIAVALHGVGLLAEWVPDYAQAMACYEESLALHRQLNNPVEIAWSLNHLGRALQAQGCYEEALGRYEEALALFEQAGHHWGIMQQAMTLAHVYIEQGAYERADELLSQSLPIARAQSYKHMEIELLRHLARSALDQGRYDTAQQLSEESLTLSRAAQEDSGIRWGLIYCGWVALAQGDLASAQALLGEALALARQHEPPWVSAWLKAKLGRTLLEEGLPAEAIRRYRESLSFYHQQKLRWGLPEGLEGLAALLSTSPTQEQLERAAVLLSAAQTLREELHTVRPAFERTLFDLARMRLEASLPPAALEAAWQLGATTPLEQVVSQVLSSPLE